ncbi:hypothetical protein JQ607_11165 [Bradyrhizobium liaoningense]|uniref:hypothetical protein n=1 Tax=Bradyrhizobium liaoningense TaxID=43992 RepID=UPI001BAD2CEF|nr:hypothetical protein [Bradyrhizobium liaoningense]MBR0840747.1 hypothetical protein [Bradyrhizobium liaoningense]MBR0858496.1 hypothetical protein [Bradyrhizobium liaoningense]
MSTADAIVAEFRAFGVGLGRDKFCARSARDIVDRCETSDVGILGIEGFYLTDTTTIPRLDHILDLSAGMKAYDTARQFLRQGEGLPLFYEFTFQD